MKHTKLETEYMERIRARLAKLRLYLNTVNLTENSDVPEWYATLAKIKAIQGNINNDLSFVACLLAKQYLEEHFNVTNFDAARKPQGASGLDIDVLTSAGERIIAEIKTTVPYSAAVNDLGAKQKESFREDFTKLNKTEATHKLFFVTDKATFEIVQCRYSKEIPGVQVILLNLQVS